jgi:hypothetical protein
MTPDQWPPGRLNDRFAAIDEHLHDIREQIRAFAPLAGQAGVLEAKVDDLEEDVRDLKRVADNLRDDRLKTLGVVIGPSLVALAGFLIAQASGRI